MVIAIKVSYVWLISCHFDTAFKANSAKAKLSTFCKSGTFLYEFKITDGQAKAEFSEEAAEADHI